MLYSVYITVMIYTHVKLASLPIIAGLLVIVTVITALIRDRYEEREDQIIHKLRGIE